MDGAQAVAQPRSGVRTAAILATAGAVLVAAYLISPEEAAWLPPCPFHWATGLHCPGCGTLRALHQLAHGNLAAALALNPVMVLMIPLLVYALLHEISDGRIGRRISVNSWVLAAVIVTFWIARNMPVYPFSMLAPH